MDSQSDKPAQSKKDALSTDSAFGAIKPQNKGKDDSVSQVSKHTGRAPSTRGAGHWHCRHKSCIGMNPVKEKRYHRVKHEIPNFAECRAFGCIYCDARKRKY